MFAISNDMIASQCNSAATVYKKASSATLFYDSFLHKTYPKIFKDANREFPLEIKIPKSMDSLLHGDFEPARIFRIEKPIAASVESKDGNIEKVPIWFGDATEGVYLRFGYENGDSRYPSVQRLDDKDIHMILGGATGQGKSVALNNIIFNLCEEYAPWEVDLTLCDSKIVEFKKYALNMPMPHISSVAATGDADYLISVLENLDNEMHKLNSVFAIVQCDKLEDFRKKTGLCYPQHLIIIDEFQTMFKNAGKKMSKLLAILDDFVRLGRNTGFHLILASQEIGQDIPAATLANIKVRGALGCDPSVSETLLGNDEAKLYYGKKGNMIVNTNASNQDKADNVLYKVPFLPVDKKLEHSKRLIDIANKLNFHRVMTFYDEEARVYESEYDKYLNQFTRTPKTILLGEPSFVIDDTEKVVKLELTGNDVENLMILSQSNTTLFRYFVMLKKNMMPFKDQVTNWVLCADPQYEKEYGASELCRDDKKFFTKKMYEDNPFFGIASSFVKRRKMMLAVDTDAFKTGESSEESDKLFYSLFEQGSEFDTQLNRSRVYYARNSLLPGGEFYKAYQLMALGQDELEEKIKDLCEVLIKSYKMYGALSTAITYDRFPPTVFWILGLNRIVGLGRDSKTNYVEAFKSTLLDSSEVNIRFFIFNTTMEDTAQLRSGIRWFIMEDVISNELSRIKCEDFPTSRAPILGVLYDSLAPSETKCYKFKKMLFDGEII